MAASLGAEVLKVDSGNGDPVRAVGPWVAGEGTLATFLDHGKSRLPCGTTGETALQPMTPSPDLVLCDEAAFAHLEGRGSHIVHTVFSMFPPGTRNADHMASEFTVMALSGLLDLVGDPVREPLRMGGHQLAYSCGIAAYAGAIAALQTPGKAGDPAQVVRVSLADTAVWLNWKSVAMASWSPAGRARLGRDAEWQVVRCADGWVALVFLEADWPVLRDFVNDTRLADPRFDDRAVRRKEARFVSDIVEEAFMRYTRHELKDLSLSRRLPLGPVWTPLELETDVQNVARGFLKRRPDGSLLMPRMPILWNGEAFS